MQPQPIFIQPIIYCIPQPIYRFQPPPLPSPPNFPFQPVTAVPPVLNFPFQPVTAVQQRLPPPQRNFGQNHLSSEVLDRPPTALHFYRGAEHNLSSIAAVPARPPFSMQVTMPLFCAQPGNMTI